ncbi:MAG: hypothetical protein JXR76_05425 [Deltaproteobacteria bacterium]|nr:hypothetical protein [Deltaproteobacteria bacterium]
MFFRNSVLAFFFVFATLFVSTSARAQLTDGTGNADQSIFGFKVSVGGRYDDVRMCVATPPGKKGGPAMDISFFSEIGLRENVSLWVNIPVMRPILFGAAFKMLQFEPEVGLLFRKATDGKVDVVAGPTLGIMLHYGPDYKSDRSGNDRGPSFFAMGPKVGGYVGLDFKRPNEKFNFQLGLSPYVAPLFGINDEDDHSGVVLGGSIDGLFRFSTH